MIASKVQARSIRCAAGVQRSPRQVTVAAATTAWGSWDSYMKRRVQTIKPKPEELKVFNEIGTFVKTSSTSFQPKFVAGRSMDAGGYKQVHVEKIPVVPLSADMHEALENMGMSALKSAMKMGEAASLDVATTSFTTSDVNAGICVTGFIMQTEAGDKKAVVAFVAAETERQASWSRLEGLLLHWACSASPGAGWHMPPPGWISIMPGKSADASGAVQCNFEKVAAAGTQQQMYVLVMSLPLSGILRSGGLSFALKASAAQNTKWLKDASTDKDFFVDLQSLPFMKL